MFFILLAFRINLLFYINLVTSVSSSTLTRPVENVITTKGLQDRNINILDGKIKVENKGKTIN